MKKALNQWCFPKGTDLETIFQLCEMYSYDGVELNLEDAGELGITLASSERDLLSIRKNADAHGLELKSLSTGLYWNTPLTHPDEEKRKIAQRILKRQLEVANLLEMDAVLVVPGLVDAQTSYATAYKRSFDSISELVPVAESYGVKIAVENVWNKFLLSPLEMRSFIDSFGSAAVGAYFDIGNVLQFGYPEHWIEILKHRIVKVHVKDFSTQVGNIQGFVPLLAGDINWASVKQSLDDISYNDYITAELTPYSSHPEVLVEHTAVAIDKIFGLGGLKS